MKKLGSKLLSLLLCAAALCSLCVLPAAAAGLAPKFQITRDEMNPVKPGEEFTLTVSMSYTNVWLTVQSMKISFSPSSAFMIKDATPSTIINKTIKRGDEVTAAIRLKAMDEITDPEQKVEVTVEFDYVNADGDLSSSSARETVYIPVETSGSVKAGAPVPVITRGDVSTVSANDAFTLNINIKNEGRSAMVQPMLSVSPGDGLNLMDAAMSRLLDDVAPGESITVPVKLQAASRLNSPSLTVNLDLKYNYPGGSDSASQALYIPAVVTPQTEEPDHSGYMELATPNVIIRQYSFGDVTQIAAGSTFDLTVEFENTSSIFTVENIVMTVSPDEGLTIASGSNTRHYPSLRAGSTQSETFSIQALPTAKTGAAKLNISFSYEYVENRQRKHVNPSQSISIPIYQPDRFEVELPMMPTVVSAYDEMYISLPYVNKGKSEVSNIRAELVSEDGAVSALTPVQNLGNFAAGASGTIDFIFTPQMPGEIDFSFLITYEDPNAEEKTLEFPVHMTVEEPWYPSFDDPVFFPGIEDPGVEEKQGMPWWGWTLIGLGAAGAAAGTVVLVKKKRKKSSGELSEFVWEAPELDSVSDTETMGGGK